MGGAGSGSGGPLTSGVAAILRPLAEAIGSGEARCAAEPGIEAGRAPASPPPREIAFSVKSMTGV